MIPCKVIFLILLLIFCVLSGDTAAQQLLSNIIKFGSREARDVYVQQLKKQNPEVQVEFVDSVFIGLITTHASVGAFSTEKKRLKRMFVASPGLAILGYESDQVVTIAQYRQSSAPWHLDRINQRSLPLDGTFTYSSEPGRVNVYVVDTGVRVGHNEFGGRARGAYSAVRGLRAGEDCSGHGTHVSSLIAGRTYGAAKRANIWSVRVFGCNGSGSTSGIIKALDWIARNARRPAVVNMSIGGGYSQSLNDATDSLARYGILPIVAAGNEATDACSKSPSSSSTALTVGASTSSDRRSSFSNHGSCVDIYAPGSNVLGAGISSNRATVYMSGTSMATPVTSGIAASILDSNSGLSAGQLKSLLESYATSSVTSSIRPLAYYPLSTSARVQECPTGYSGPNCEVALCYAVPATDAGACSGNGRCISPNRCICNSNYIGPTCANLRPGKKPDQPGRPGPEPGQPSQPSGPQPGEGKVVALISGSPSRIVRFSNNPSPLTLDASVSHLTTELQREICSAGQVKAEGAGAESTWIFAVGIPNSTSAGEQPSSNGEEASSSDSMDGIWNPIEAPSGMGSGGESSGAEGGSQPSAEGAASSESGGAESGGSSQPQEGGNASPMEQPINVPSSLDSGESQPQEGGASQPSQPQEGAASQPQEGGASQPSQPQEGGRAASQPDSSSSAEQPSAELGIEAAHNVGLLSTEQQVETINRIFQEEEQARAAGLDEESAPSTNATATAEGSESGSTSGLKYTWECKSEITNSAQNPYCSNASFPEEARLTLSPGDLQKMAGMGPILFTVTVEQAGYASEAHAVVQVEQS